MNPIHIIGMGMGSPDLTSRHHAIIETAEILVGGKRHLAEFPDFKGETVPITTGIRDLALSLGKKAETKTVVVLASGDPLFYGIGSVFADALGKDSVVIHPNITSVGAAFAKIKEPWQDAGVISLHGRNSDAELAARIKAHETVAVFTDPKNNPAWLARCLLEQGFSGYRICVLECLGSDNEQVRWFDLHEAAEQSFTDPNLVILKRMPGEDNPVQRLNIGMADECFAHQKGLITKAEVRVVSLSKLSLEPDQVMWDLGAGSGSVSVEAAGMIKHGSIHAVEQHEERIKDIKENVARFGVFHVQAHHGALPEAMDGLPDPDRIFVGGGGKNLYAILKKACGRLKEEGIIVVNTVLISNVQTAMNALKEAGLETDIVQIQVSTGHEMPWDLMLKAQNPVFVIRGKKR